MVQLFDLILDCAARAMEKQTQPSGALPGGNNGPWGVPETPVRNTGHWAITFLHCYERTGEEAYREAAAAAVGYLTSDEARPGDATFHHLTSPDGDSCNGLIGQAWTIEALTVAVNRLDRPDLVDLAEEVYLLHPFDGQLCAWKPVEVDGTVLPMDMTFNHQLWFAAAGGLLARHPRSSDEVGRRVERFMDELGENLNVHGGGLVYHPFKPDFDLRKYGRIFLEGARAGLAPTMVLGVLRPMLPGGGDGDNWHDHSVGYHSFNLYALAMLKDAFPDHPFWGHEKFTRALSYARTDEFVERLDGNVYGYPYNVTGIEMAYVLEAFDVADEKERRRWLERQFERTYDPEREMLSRNTADPETLTARLYEATRTSDVEISVPTSTPTEDRLETDR